jgi:uncharacterized protein YggT (Ycf19 family)
MSGGRIRSGFLQVSRVLVWVVNAVVLAYLAVLTIAFVLQLLGADPSASFVDWIYRASARVMQPFRGAFPTQQVTDKSVFNASLLFAAIVYSLLALLLNAALIWLSDRIDAIAARRYVRESASQSWPPSGAPAVPGQPGVPQPQLGYPQNR